MNLLGEVKTGGIVVQVIEKRNKMLATTLSISV